MEITKSDMFYSNLGDNRTHYPTRSYLDVTASQFPDDVTSAFTNDVAATTAPLANTKRTSSDPAWLMHIYLVIGVVGMVGNLGILFVMYRFPALRKSNTNIYIISQSFVDLLGSLIITLNTYVKDEGRYIDGFIGQLYCRLWVTAFPLWSSFVTSSFNLVAMSIERYLAIVHPIWHRKHFTRSKLTISLVLVWITGPLINLHIVIVTQVRGGRCVRPTDLAAKQEAVAVGITTIILQFIIPLVIHIYCYTKMMLAFSKKTPTVAPAAPNQNPVATTNTQNAHQVRRNQQIRKNVFRTLLYVTLMFIFCWVWNQSVWLGFNLGLIDNSIFRSPVKHFTVVVLFANCAVNPFLYMFNYLPVRKAFLSMFPCGSNSEDMSVNHTGTTSNNAAN